MKKNILFLGEASLIAIVLVLIAYLIEKIIKKKTGDQERVLTTRKIVVTGMFSAIAAVLMLFEIPLFFAPGFYKIDLSELPVLICAYAFGPVAGVLTELIKILLKLVMKPSSTAFVGELANFLVGVSFVLPASLVYLSKKTKKGAITSCITGTLVMTVFGSLLNAFYLLPAFAELFGMEMDAIIAMGTAVNKNITNLPSLVLFAVVPLNLIKGTIVSILTLLVYKRLSPLIKGKH